MTQAEKLRERYKSLHRSFTKPTRQEELLLFQLEVAIVQLTLMEELADAKLAAALDC
jgi:hypothetical protein